MGMFSDVFGLFKALLEDLGSLFDSYPKEKRFNQNISDDNDLPKWGPDSHEPWDFLSEEDWESVLRGEKPLEDFTASHVWPPQIEEDDIAEAEQEVNTPSAESNDIDDSAYTGEGSGDFSSDDFGPGDSGNYDSYIG